MYKDGQRPEVGDQETFTLRNLTAVELFKQRKLMCINPCGHWFDADALVITWQKLVGPLAAPDAEQSSNPLM